MAKFALKLMSDEDGREVTRHYSDLESANRAFRWALLREPGMIIVGLFDEQGHRIKSASERSHEQFLAEHAAENQRAADEAELREARLKADPSERMAEGAMKLFWYGLGILFLGWLLSIF